MSNSCEFLRRFFVAALACIALGASAQPYPAKPIHLIAPLPAGGSIDNLARVVARRLEARFGVPVIVENRPGAAATLGTAAVAKAPPDGYTLLLVNSSHVINPHIYPKLAFDALNDFAPVTLMVSLPMGMFVNNAVAARDVREFIALARSQPTAISYSSAGNGSVSHLLGAMFTLQTKTTIAHVPYRGSAPALVDTIGGQVQVMFADTALAAPAVSSGKLRALAVATPRRVGSLPGVPTFVESGLPELLLSSQVGIVVPAGTPASVVATLNREIVAILKDPAISAELMSKGFEVVASSPEEMNAVMRADLDRFGAIVRDGRIKAD